MAEKYAAKGSAISIGDSTDGASTIYTPIPSFRSIGNSGGEAERIDVTTHDSVGGRREFRQGFKGEVTVTFEIIYDPADATHQLLAELFDSGERRDFRVTLTDADASEIDFVAFVNNFPIPNLPIDDAMTLEVALTVDGAIILPGVS